MTGECQVEAPVALFALARVRRARRARRAAGAHGPHHCGRVRGPTRGLPVQPLALRPRPQAHRAPPLDWRDAPRLRLQRPPAPPATRPRRECSQPPPADSGCRRGRLAAGVIVYSRGAA